MRRLEDIVPADTITIADQVMELPTNSVVVSTVGHRTCDVVHDVLLRTGRSGWLTCRPSTPADQRYLRWSDVVQWIEDNLACNRQIHVLHEGTVDK